VTLYLYLENEAATQIFATDLACALQPQDFVALRGDLGSGKSTLARALIRTLMRDRSLEVPSPTFSLIQHYQCDRFELAHADLYRLSNFQEIEELGLIEILNQGILLVEWPEHAGDLLPSPTFLLEFDYQAEGRQLKVSMTQDASARLQRSRQIRIFLDEAGKGEAQRYYLAGDASSRRYETIITDNMCEKYVLMDAAQMHPTHTATPINYAQSVHLAQDVRQFVGMARLLENKGFGAPRIFASDLNGALLLLEHLGQEGIVNKTGSVMMERVLAAAELLADIHSTHWPVETSWPDLVLKIPTYDQQTLYRETCLLLDWYLPYQLGVDVTNPMRQLYGDIWDELTLRLQQAEQGLCLRDYHSPNIIWREEKSGHARLGLIDFQDALIGPVAYDVASLAQDARVTITIEQEAAIIEAYCARRKFHDTLFDETGLRNIYPLAATQRVMKILGLFVRLDQRDGKPDYLKALPRLLDYLQRNLQSPDLAALRLFCLTYKICFP